MPTSSSTPMSLHLEEHSLKMQSEQVAPAPLALLEERTLKPDIDETCETLQCCCCRLRTPWYTCSRWPARSAAASHCRRCIRYLWAAGPQSASWLRRSPLTDVEAGHYNGEQNLKNSLCFILILPHYTQFGDHSATLLLDGFDKSGSQVNNIEGATVQRCRKTFLAFTAKTHSCNSGWAITFREQETCRTCLDKPDGIFQGTM